MTTPMRRLADLLRRLRRRDGADDLGEELEHHRALVQADLERRGVAADRAAVESRRVMGNLTLAQEDAREIRVVGWADRLGRDLRVAARRLAVVGSAAPRSPSAASLIARWVFISSRRASSMRRRFSQ